MNIPLSGNVVPLASRWHVIQEIDVARLIADHRRLGELCDLLERCADDLPDMPSDAVVEQICEALSVLTTTSDDRDDPSYPALNALFDAEDPLSAALMQDMAARYAADAEHAHDLAEALRRTPDMAGRVTPNTLGYMLRCFFDDCRQAMDCEELAILALARHRLTQAARTLLLDSLRFRASPRRPAIA